MYGRLGFGNHVGPKDPTRPELCPQCKKIEVNREAVHIAKEIKKLKNSNQVAGMWSRSVCL